MSLLSAVQTGPRQDFQSFIPLRHRLLTRKQLGAWLDITPDRLTIWARLGQGPPVIRVGRRRLYQVGSVLDWLAKQSVSAASEAEG
jgi:hypothetical protein